MRKKSLYNNDTFHRRPKVFNCEIVWNSTTDYCKTFLVCPGEGIGCSMLILLLFSRNSMSVRSKYDRNETGFAWREHLTFLTKRDDPATWFRFRKSVDRLVRWCFFRKFSPNNSLKNVHQSPSKTLCIRACFNVQNRFRRTARRCDLAE